MYPPLPELLLPLGKLFRRFVDVCHLELFTEFVLVHPDNVVLRQSLAGYKDVFERLEVRNGGGGEEVGDVLAVVRFGGYGHWLEASVRIYDFEQEKYCSRREIDIGRYDETSCPGQARSQALGDRSEDNATRRKDGINVADGGDEADGAQG